MTGLSRLYLLMHEGAPLMWGTTQGDIREAILSYPEDDADLFSVWTVPSPNKLSVSEEITTRFAQAWATRIDPGKPIPAFVLEHIVPAEAAA
jgi:hypothetical protein